MSRFTKLAPNAFDQIAMGAGILVKEFTPSTGAYSGLLGVTSGGVSFTATPSYKDFGEDMDNVPKNTLQLKRIESLEVKMSGTYANMSAELAKMVTGGADIDSLDSTHIVPRIDLVAADYNDLWLICDYSSDISESTGGFIAVHMMNALSTGGFQLQTTDRDKGKFAFEYTGHYDYNSPDTVPFEIYIQTGETLTALTVSSVAGTSSGKTALTVSGYTPSGNETYCYKTAGTVALPDRGDSVSTWTSWNGSAEITATTGNDIAVVVQDAHNQAIAGGKTKVVAKA